MMRRKMAGCLFMLLASGCSLTAGFAPPATANPSVTPQLNNFTATVETSPQPTATQERTPLSPTEQSEPPDALSEVCSPLHGFQLAQLEDIISTPFDPPSPGSDSGHHGVDFGFYSYGPFSSMEGLPVQSILQGRVAAVIDNRPPYGNMVIVETSYTSLPVAWQNYLDELPALTDYKMDSRLACPSPDDDLSSIDERSLYLLYAHMSETPQLVVGEEIGCGQQLGFVGNSGFSGNTHLHLEARLGKSGVQFLHLAHYINNASAEEMSNYCAWRIGPHFRLIDPLEMLNAE